MIFAIPLLLTILTTLLRPSLSKIQSKYQVTNDFKLTIDLYDSFSGNDLDFTISTDPKAEIADV
jgi:hypothetical protein